MKKYMTPEEKQKRFDKVCEYVVTIIVSAVTTMIVYYLMNI